MADKTNFIFVAHQGKKRAAPTGSEAKLVRSELQRRTWQERRLRSAQKLRNSSSVPTSVSTVTTRPCQHTGIVGVGGSVNDGTQNRLRATTITCPVCGQRIDVRSAPGLRTLVDNGTVDPFDTMVVKMTKDMQKLLRIGKIHLDIVLIGMAAGTARIRHHRGLLLTDSRSSLPRRGSPLSRTRRSRHRPLTAYPAEEP